MPQLFVATGATKWNDPKEFPWTMGWQPNYQSEARIYAKYILREKPNAKIAVLYQNDDYGKDYLKGLKDGLGAKAASMIVAEESYETTEPTIDSHIVKLKASGADVFFDVAIPKFAAQAIMKIDEIGWKPLHLLNNVSASIGATMKPAGFDRSQGIISSAWLKDPTDPQWKNDPGMKTWNAFLDKYYPGSQPHGRQRDLRLHRRARPRARAEGLRRRSDAGERHEAGSQHQRTCAGWLAAGHQGLHQRDRFRSGQAVAAREIPGRHLDRFGDVISGEIGG